MLVLTEQELHNLQNYIIRHSYIQKVFTTQLAYMNSGLSRVAVYSVGVGVQQKQFMYSAQFTKKEFDAICGKRNIFQLILEKYLGDKK